MPHLLTNITRIDVECVIRAACALDSLFSFSSVIKRDIARQLFAQTIFIVERLSFERFIGTVVMAMHGKYNFNQRLFRGIRYDATSGLFIYDRAVSRCLYVNLQ